MKALQSNHPKRVTGSAYREGLRIPQSKVIPQASQSRNGSDSRSEQERRQRAESERRERALLWTDDRPFSIWK
jgi:hypothetical protein